MIQILPVIVGKVVRTVGNKLYVKHGDTVDVYNTDYYRVVER